MTLYQQEMLRKLGRLDCAGRYDEEKGLLVISSGGTGLCCQDKKGYLSWESEKIRTEEEKAVLSQIGEQAKLIRAYVGQYENSPSMGIPEVEGYRRMAECGDIIMPEENPATFFMISLITQQLYREILAVADENGGKLKNRCVFFCDEFGTLPKIESAEMMFSASRSRRLQIVPIIQSFSQLEKNYGKEGAEIIIDNTQLTIFGGFAPQSTSAETLSKALGSCTVMSGSVSRSKNDPSESLQMIERPLMTPDELKSMPKGQFVVMKTGFYPMKVKLKLFFKWGIRFDEEHPYSVPDQGNRRVEYAEKKEIMDKIVEKYRPDLLHPPMPSDDDGGAYGGQRQVMADPEAQGGGRAPGRERARDGGVSVQTSPRNRRMPEPPVTGKTAEVKSDGQA